MDFPYLSIKYSIREDVGRNPGLLFALRRIDFSAVTVKAEGEQKAGNKAVFSQYGIS